MLSCLTEKQREAFNRFSKLKVGALFMEMGTGKTLTTIELINFNKNNIDLVVLFTPFSTKKNLQEEIKKWSCDVEIIIFGWETLSQSDYKYLDLIKKIENKRLFIVADESVFIKNQDTKRYKRLKKVSKYSDYRLILNGTPITKNEWDLYYQMNFLSPKIIGMNESEFLQTFYKKIKYKKRGGKPKTFYQLSKINIEYLHNLIERYIFKVDFNFKYNEKEEVFLISPKEETKEKYEEIKNNHLENLGQFNSEEIIKLLQKLSIISANDENKAEQIAKFIKDKKIILFCQFNKEIEKITKYLKNYLVINGSVKTEEREITFDIFKNNKIPLIITFGTGSFGLNLQFCNKMAFSSLTMDYAKVLQSKARIKRIGQNQDIKYYYFDVDLKINRFIKKNIKKKEYLNDILIKRIKNGKII